MNTACISDFIRAHRNVSITIKINLVSLRRRSGTQKRSFFFLYTHSNLYTESQRKKINKLISKFKNDKAFDRAEIGHFSSDI